MLFCLVVLNVTNSDGMYMYALGSDNSCGHDNVTQGGGQNGKMVIA